MSENKWFEETTFSTVQLAGNDTFEFIPVPFQPLTRFEKLKRKLKEYETRARHAWYVLKYGVE